jgi:hypothetical protein
MPTVTIDLRSSEPWEAGSTLLSYLAYPRIDQDCEERALYERALQHKILRHLATTLPGWATQKVLIRPAVALMTEGEVRRATRQSDRRMRDRSVAGKMAVALIAQSVTGKPTKLPKPMTRLSLNQLAEFFLEFSKEVEPTNVIKRAWTASKPVVHLAAAFEIYKRMARDRGLPGMLPDVQFIPGALEEILAIAADHVRQVTTNPTINIRPDALIQFALAK